MQIFNKKDTQKKATTKLPMTGKVRTGFRRYCMAVLALTMLVLFFVVGVMRTCGNFADVKFHLRTWEDNPLYRTEYGTYNRHLLPTERNG